jgi:hypothetical protein
MAYSTSTFQIGFTLGASSIEPKINLAITAEVFIARLTVEDNRLLQPYDEHSSGFGLLTLS